MTAVTQRSENSKEDLNKFKHTFGGDFQLLDAIAVYVGCEDDSHDFKRRKGFRRKVSSTSNQNEVFIV